jgi:cation:H+ antiporter
MSDELNMIWLNLLFFMLSCLALVLSSTLLIRSIEKISFFLRIKLFIISFIILGVGTSLPELFVGINAALMGNPTLSFSNIIGANFIDITLIVGLPVLIFRGIRVQSKEERKDIFYMFGCALLPIIFLFFGGSINRWEGAILILAFILYNYSLIREQKEFKKKPDLRFRHFVVLLYFLLAVFSLAMLYFSSRFAVGYALSIADDLKFSAMLVGLIIISLGTTLPELVVSIQSIISREKELMVGNVVGSLVANSTLIVGIVALIHPIELAFTAMLLPFIFLIFGIILFMAFAERGRVIGVTQGLVLVMLYIIFLIVELAPAGLKG